MLKGFKNTAKNKTLERRVGEALPGSEFSVGFYASSQSDSVGGGRLPQWAGWETGCEEPCPHPATFI